jgi:hypothetical protein
MEINKQEKDYQATETDEIKRLLSRANYGDVTETERSLYQELKKRLSEKELTDFCDHLTNNH